jgi:hypothetical protein
MSFFDNLGGMLGKLTGADPSDVADAATDHVEGMDAGQLADHLKNSIPNMDSSSLGGLAQSVMNALSAHGHDESTINDSGVDTAAAQSGDAGSVMDLISHAQQNPGALKDAAMNFIRDNPQAVQQFTPDFLKGIVGKLTGH